jgi:hypothetical protein
MASKRVAHRDAYDQADRSDGVPPKKKSRGATSYLKAARCWNLSDKGSTVKVGVIGRTVTASISNVVDLTEERPRYPKLFVSVSEMYDIQDKSTTDNLLADTIFLNLSEIKGLKGTVHYYMSKVEENGKFKDRSKLVSLTEEEERGHFEYPYLADPRTTISIHRKVTKITKYEVQYGDNQMNQCRIPVGKVTLTFGELCSLNKVIDDVYERMSKLQQAHDRLGELIRVEAGKCLSNLLYTDFGKFSDNMVDKCDSSLLLAFMRVHGEFVGLSFGSSLLQKVFSEMKKQKIKPNGISIVSLVYQIMNQVYPLFTTDYIKCPK